MLSIPGNTYAEVFSNLSAHPELTDRERTAAGAIAAWFAERDRLRATREAAQDDPDYDPTFDDTDPIGDHTRKAPFHGPTFPEGVKGQEWRTWCYGPIRFTVRPHTTGNTMNVGVDQVGTNPPTCSLLPIDVGFDVKTTGHLVTLRHEDCAEGYRYRDAAGAERVARGDPRAVAEELARAGYRTRAYSTPNGRDVRCVPEGDGLRWEVQPRTDNYWVTRATLEQATAEAGWDPAEFTGPT